MFDRKLRALPLSAASAVDRPAAGLRPVSVAVTRRRLGGPLAGLACALLLASCGGGSGGGSGDATAASTAAASATPAGGASAGATAASAPASAPPVSVTVVKAQARPYPVTLDLSGTVSALSAVEVRPQISAPVAQVHVQEGQMVRAGQPLFTLEAKADEVALRKAEAQVQKDLATLADAQRQLGRQQELLARGFISQGAVDTAQANVAAQQATLAADRAAVDAVRVQLGYARIVAPAGGRVGQINVWPGSLVTPGGAALLTITRMNPVTVSFALPQRHLPDALAALQRGDAPVLALLRPEAAGEGREGRGGRGAARAGEGAASGAAAASAASAAGRATEATPAGSAAAAGPAASAASGAGKAGGKGEAGVLCVPPRAERLLAEEPGARRAAGPGSNSPAGGPGGPGSAGRAATGDGPDAPRRAAGERGTMPQAAASAAGGARSATGGRGGPDGAARTDDGRRCGVLRFIDSQVDAATGTVKAKALFANADQALWPGAYVPLRLQLRTLERAIVVPQAAIVQGTRGASVFVVDAQGQAEQRPVQLLLGAGTDAVVSGLKPGEQVVLDGRQNVRPGAKLVIRPADGGGRASGNGSGSVPGASGPGGGNAAASEATPSPAGVTATPASGNARGG